MGETERSDTEKEEVWGVVSRGKLNQHFVSWAAVRKQLVVSLQGGEIPREVAVVFILLMRKPRVKKLGKGHSIDVS